MAVYSRYSRIVSTDGKVMNVRDALSEINRAVDEILGGLEIDQESRFCVDLYRLSGFDLVEFDDANKTAIYRVVSVDRLLKLGMLTQDGSNVYLTEREKLDFSQESFVWCAAQELALAMETGIDVMSGTKAEAEDRTGSNACARIVHRIGLGVAEKAKNLAYQLYTIAERKHWTGETHLYNNLVSGWPKVLEEAARITAKLKNEQIEINLEA